jgi:hypothetical protein
MTNPDALMALITAIVANDDAAVAARLAASPALARAALGEGATRQAAGDFFIPQIGRYLVTGDTALHIAAAGYRTDMVRRLLAAGADPRARNRRGAEPLHAAANGGPGAQSWNPEAQVATIAALIAAGADPNAPDKSGTAPLHKAVRGPCAAAVEALIRAGADARLKTKSGTTPLRLAEVTTGRSGSGSVEARAEKALILERLHRLASA